MKRRRAIRVYVGLRLFGFERPGIAVRPLWRETLCVWIRELLTAVDALEKENTIPLHWNLSLSPFLDRPFRLPDDLQRALTARVSRGKDRLIPAGFRGSFHPFLTFNELESELAWCARNPWTPGFAELFGRDPQILVPSMPDLQRELSQGVYSAAGFKMIGYPFSGSRRYFFASKSRKGRASFFAAVSCGLDSLQARARSLPRMLAAGEERIFLLLTPSLADIALPSTAARLPARLSDLLQEVCEPRFEALGARRLETRAAAPETAASLAVDGFLETSPETRSLWQAVRPPLRSGSRHSGLNPPLRSGSRRSGLNPPLRSGLCPPASRRRTSQQDRRRVLEAFSLDPQIPLPGPVHREPPSPPERFPTAQMTGSAVLRGDSLEARFSEGRLCGFFCADRPLLPITPCRSYLTIAGGPTYPFVPEGANSFEAEGETGLRSFFELKGRRGSVEQPGRLTIDSFFREGCPEMHFEVSIQYPVFPKNTILQEIVPLEIPLAMIEPSASLRISPLRAQPSASLRISPLRAQPSAPLAFQAGYPDGSGYHVSFPDGRDARLLFGSHFTFPGADSGPLLKLSMASPEIASLLIRPRRQGRRFMLTAGLHGIWSAISASLTNGREERFSFSLGHAR